MLQHVILVETIAFIKLLKISVKIKRCFIFINKIDKL
jgi:hypothetical protein